jgi:predicted exporter
MLIYVEADSPEELLRRSHAAAARLETKDAKAVRVRGVFGLSSLLPDPGVVARRRDAISAAEVDQIVKDFHAAIRASSFSESAYEPYEQFLHRILLRPAPPTIQDLLPFRRLAEMVLSREELATGRPANKWQSITAVFFDRSLDDLAARGSAIKTIRGLLADVPGVTLTGMSVIGYDTQATIARDLPRLMGIAVILVAAYLLIHFRSFGKAGLAMLPAIFSIVCRLAFMRVSGETFNLINLISLPLLVGIDVDYGVFIVSLASRKFGEAKNGVPRGISAASHSVMVSALANFLGFGSLITTSVPAIRSLGWAVGIGIIACTIATFFLLVPLLGTRKEPA